MSTEMTDSIINFSLLPRPLFPKTEKCGQISVPLNDGRVPMPG